MPSGQVGSPTFALVHEYPGRIPLIHVDLYRLPALEIDFLLALEDYWQQPVVTVIEWAERLQADLPEEYLDITLTWMADQTRSNNFFGVGPRGKELAAGLPGLDRIDAETTGKLEEDQWRKSKKPPSINSNPKKPMSSSPFPQNCWNLAQKNLTYILVRSGRSAHGRGRLGLSPETSG